MKLLKKKRNWNKRNKTFSKKNSKKKRKIKTKHIIETTSKAKNHNQWSKRTF